MPHRLPALLLLLCLGCQPKAQPLDPVAIKPLEDRLHDVEHLLEQSASQYRGRDRIAAEHSLRRAHELYQEELEPLITEGQADQRLMLEYYFGRAYDEITPRRGGDPGRWTSRLIVGLEGLTLRELGDATVASQQEP